MQRLLVSVSLLISSSFVFAAPLFFAKEGCGADAGKVEATKLRPCSSWGGGSSSKDLADLTIYTISEFGFDVITLKIGIWYNSESCDSGTQYTSGLELLAVNCEDAINFVDQIAEISGESRNNYLIGKYLDEEPTDGGLEGAVLRRYLY
jgi:hypothetical protein